MTKIIFRILVVLKSIVLFPIAMLTVVIGLGIVTPIHWTVYYIYTGKPLYTFGVGTDTWFFRFADWCTQLKYED